MRATTIRRYPSCASDLRLLRSRKPVRNAVLKTSRRQWCACNAEQSCPRGLSDPLAHREHREHRAHRERRRLQGHLGRRKRLVGSSSQSEGNEGLRECGPLVFSWWIGGLAGRAYRFDSDAVRGSSILLALRPAGVASGAGVSVLSTKLMSSCWECMSSLR